MSEMHTCNIQGPTLCAFLVGGDPPAPRVGHRLVYVVGVVFERFLVVFVKLLGFWVCLGLLWFLGL